VDEIAQLRLADASLTTIANPYGGQIGQKRCA